MEGDEDKRGQVNLLHVKENVRKLTLVFEILYEISNFSEIRCRFCGDALKTR